MREDLSTYGKYTLVERIGDGPTSEVFRAIRSDGDGANRSLAIKRVAPLLQRDGSFSRAFLEGAARASSVSHPYLARVLDFGEQDGSLFVASEYRPGYSLRVVLEYQRRMGHPFPAPMVVFLALCLAEALKESHNHVDVEDNLAPFVHGDIKPSNITIGFDGLPLLHDLGIGTPGRLDTAGPLFWLARENLPYMAPEQLRTEEADPRLDVYAIGAVMFELLTLEPLLPPGNLLGMLDALGSLDYGERLKRLKSTHVPPALSRIVQGAVQRKPSARFPTAAELAAALAEIQLPGYESAPARWSGLLQTIRTEQAEALESKAEYTLSSVGEVTVEPWDLCWATDALCTAAVWLEHTQEDERRAHATDSGKEAQNGIILIDESDLEEWDGSTLSLTETITLTVGDTDILPEEFAGELAEDADQSVDQPIAPSGPLELNVEDLENVGEADEEDHFDTEEAVVLAAGEDDGVSDEEPEQYGEDSEQLIGDEPDAIPAIISQDTVSDLESALARLEHLAPEEAQAFESDGEDRSTDVSESDGVADIVETADGDDSELVGEAVPFEGEIEQDEEDTASLGLSQDDFMTTTLPDNLDLITPIVYDPDAVGEGAEIALGGEEDDLEEGELVSAPEASEVGAGEGAGEPGEQGMDTVEADGGPEAVDSVVDADELPFHAEEAAGVVEAVDVPIQPQEVDAEDGSLVSDDAAEVPDALALEQSQEIPDEVLGSALSDSDERVETPMTEEFPAEDGIGEAMDASDVAGDGLAVGALPEPEGAVVSGGDAHSVSVPGEFEHDIDPVDDLAEPPEPVSLTGSQALEPDATTGEAAPVEEIPGATEEGTSTLPVGDERGLEQDTFVQLDDQGEPYDDEITGELAVDVLDAGLADDPLGDDTLSAELDALLGHTYEGAFPSSEEGDANAPMEIEALSVSDVPIEDLPDSTTVDLAAEQSVRGRIEEIPELLQHPPQEGTLPSLGLEGIAAETQSEQDDAPLGESVAARSGGHQPDQSGVVADLYVPSAADGASSGSSEHEGASVRADPVGAMRRPVLPPGVVLGGRVRVIRLLVELPFKTLYQARTTQNERLLPCPKCGYKNNLEEDVRCYRCGLPRPPEAVTLTARRGGRQQQLNLAWSKLEKFHPNLALVYDDIIRGDMHYRILDPLTAHPSTGVLLTQLEPPVSSRLLARMALQCARGLQFLHDNGVTCRPFDDTNIYLHEDFIQLYDIDVAEIVPGEIVPGDARIENVAALGEVLLRFAPEQRSGVEDVLEQAAHGKYVSADAFAKAMAGTSRGR